MSDNLQKPILLIPYADVRDGLESLAGNEAATFNNGSPQSIAASSYNNSAKDLAHWILLTTQHPKRVQRFMMYPFSNEVQNVLREVHFNDIQLNLPVENPSRRINLTGAELEDLKSLLGNFKALKDSIIRVSFDPVEGRYQVTLLPPPKEHPTNGDGSLNGAWAVSNLSDNPVVTNLIVEESDRIINGARELIIPGSARIIRPQLVTLSPGLADGKKYVDYWVVPPEQSNPRGSAVTYHIGDARERRSGRDLIKALIQASTPKRKDGKIPTLAFDVDGTLVNARWYVWKIFVQWIECYTPKLEAYSIPQMDDEPDEVYRRRLENPQELYDRAVESIKRVRERVKSGFKPPLKDTWNTDTILSRVFDIKDSIILAHAYDYFHQLFYNPRRSLEAPPIPGMVKLVSLLQSFGFKIIYPTLRSAEDDEMPGGEGSATIAALKRLGIWNKHSVLLRHKGKKLNWRSGTRNEPPKAGMIRPYVRNHPQIWVSGVADNDPKHIAGYLELQDGVFIHVEGDRPLGKEKLIVPNGAHSIRNYQAFENEIDEWVERSKPGLDRWFTKKGEKLATKLHTAVNRIHSRIFSESEDVDYSSQVKLQNPSLIESQCDDARAVLNEVSSYPKGNPLRRSFIHTLNVAISDKKISMDTLDTILEIINTHGRYGGDPSTFSIEKQDDSVINIRRLIGGSPLKEIDSPAQNVDRKTTPIAPQDPAAFDDLEKTLLNISAGPDFFAIKSGQRYARLLEDDFPRMEALLSMVVGRLSSLTGKPAHQIRAVEYEPRLSGAALIALARLGVDTRWSSKHIRHRAHTQRQLDRLPEDLRTRIKYSARNDEEIHDLPDAVSRRIAMTDAGKPDLLSRVDLAIWNIPRSNRNIDRMGKHLAEGGFLVVQSKNDLRHSDCTGWQCIASAKVTAGDYLIPSAFLPVPVLARPLHLQVWQRLAF